MSKCENCKEDFCAEELHWYNINGNCSDNDYHLMVNPDSMFVRLCDECYEQILELKNISFEDYVFFNTKSTKD